jgi:hypothetical protein
MVALAAVTTALREYGVMVNSHSAAAALHRFDYDLEGDTVAAVAWTDAPFVDPDLPPELAALVRAHMHLACAAPSAAASFDPTCSGDCSHPFLEA